MAHAAVEIRTPNAQRESKGDAAAYGESGLPFARTCLSRLASRNGPSEWKARVLHLANV